MLDSNRPVDHGAGDGGNEDGRGRVTVLERDPGESLAEALSGLAPAGAPGFGVELLDDGRVRTLFPEARGELEPTFFETLRDHQAAGHLGAAGAPPVRERPRPQVRWPDHLPHHHSDPEPHALGQAPRPPGRGLERRSGRPPERVRERAADRRTRGATAQVAAVEDEKLLAAMGRIVALVTRVDSLFPRLVFMVAGFTAIGSLALAYIEALPLPTGAAFILGPAVLTTILLGLWFPEWGRRALIGWLAGIAATICYDVARLAAVELGVFGDPIPLIGNLLLDRDDVPFTVGYAWRFMGNGGGMAIAFTMLPWRGIKAGMIYGTMICLGLFAVLFFFPVSQTHFFPLTPLTAVVGMLGHWIYGAVLGGITKRCLPPATVRAAARAGGTGGAWVPRGIPGAAAPAT